MRLGEVLLILMFIHINTTYRSLGLPSVKKKTQTKKEATRRRRKKKSIFFFHLHPLWRQGLPAGGGGRDRHDHDGGGRQEVAQVDEGEVLGRVCGWVGGWVCTPQKKTSHTTQNTQSDT